MTLSLALATLELWLGVTLLSLVDALLLRMAGSRATIIRAAAGGASQNLLIVTSLRFFGFGLTGWALSAWLYAGIFAAGDSNTFNWIGYRFLHDWQARGTAQVLEGGLQTNA